MVMGSVHPTRIIFTLSVFCTLPVTCAERQVKHNDFCHFTATVLDFKDNAVHLRNYHNHRPGNIDPNASI